MGTRSLDDLKKSQSLVEFLRIDRQLFSAEKKS